MNCWLFITTPDNWEVTRKKGVLGFAQRHERRLSKVHKQDKGLIYIKGDYAVSGDYEITSEVYRDETEIFKSPRGKWYDKFPLRLNIRCLTPSAEPIAFKPLIPSLGFIRNKNNWGATLQGNALLRIPEQDYKTILSAF